MFLMGPIMSLKICILSSGSSGNALFIESEKTKILIDAGLNAKQISLRLSSIGININDINAICLSHEHGDHTQAINILQKKHKIPIYVNYLTKEALIKNDKFKDLHYKIFESGTTFLIGDLSIETFLVPHDAAEPVGFKITNKNKSIGIITDVGIPTPLIMDKLKNCNLLVVEANYDEDLLIDAQRPYKLKQRIRGNLGHLSNIDSAKIITACHHKNLKHVILAHLSSDCNTPRIASDTVRSQLILESIDNLEINVSLSSKPTSVFNV